MELRTYILAGPQARTRYVRDFWPRHIASLRRHDITVHGVWTDESVDARRVFALVGYPPDRDPAELAEKYRASADFIDDHAEFDPSLIVSQTSVTLGAVVGSPGC